MGVLRKPYLLFLVRPGLLVGGLLHVCAMCIMCTFLACWWCRVCSSSQHPQQTQHAKCVGGKATTHASAHRGAQLYSQFSSNNHRGDSRGVASVVSLAATRARTRSMQQQQQQQQSAARGEYVCGYCQRVVSGEERARWLRQLFSVACDASPHLSHLSAIFLFHLSAHPQPYFISFQLSAHAQQYCCSAHAQRGLRRLHNSPYSEQSNKQPRT